MISAKALSVKWMHSSAVLLIVVLSCAAAMNIDLDNHWKIFKTAFNKFYSNPSKEARRQEIFEKNVAFIIRHNLEQDLGKHSFRLGVNHMTDWSTEEYVNTRISFRPTSIDINANNLAHLGKSLAHKSIDYRTKGWVSPVVNQSTCAAGYAFAVAGAIEAQIANITGKLVQLSAQNIIDCSQAEGNNGCDDGNTFAAYQYVIDNKGIDTLATYPYLGALGRCQYVASNSGGCVTKYQVLHSLDEDAIITALNTIGPLSAMINAALPSFQAYKGGVYDDSKCDGKLLNHAVLVIGYGTSNSATEQLGQKGTPYWLVKNSFGSSWGEAGYMKVARGKNMCGVAQHISYPIVQVPKDKKI